MCLCSILREVSWLRGVPARYKGQPRKVHAVLDMQSPRNTKQLQQLTGRISALNRFILRSTNKCLPLFKILRKTFTWSEECEEAFNQLKQYLESPPLHSMPAKGEPLYLYLVISALAVSSVLI